MLWSPKDFFALRYVRLVKLRNVIVAQVHIRILSRTEPRSNPADQYGVATFYLGCLLHYILLYVNG